MGRGPGLYWGMVLAGLASPVAAQSVWDPIISNSHWYVPVPNMLAYAAPSTSFANPIPIGDQTLWALGTSTNGLFTGISYGQLAMGPTLSTSTQSIQGTVTPSGEISMVFTSTDGGPATIGLGRMTERGGITQMEMQMITGTALLVTHWAYMVPYDPATFTPPQAQVVPSPAASNWAWMQGTPWRMTSPGLFGAPGAGNLVITNFQGGYFWGLAVGPGGSGAGTYTVLGSVTPEGRVLFNTIADGQLVSLYGAAEGDPAAAAMLLGTYSADALFTGDITVLSLVQPYAQAVAAAGNPSALGAATTLYGVAGTVQGLLGPLAPAIAALNGLEGAALSTAISQTLPVLNGAGAQATYATQRAFQQVVMGRLDTVHGPDAPGAERNIWLRPFGNFADQGTQSGVAGYSASGGGLAAGMDASVGPDAVLGMVAAYSATSITGGNDLVPNGLDVSTYQFGLYGAYGLAPDLDLTFQLDGGYNRNSAQRTIAFMGSAAGADYDGWTGHGGIGLSQRFLLSPDLSVSPLVRLDYAQVQADGYTESGAGALDLTVSSQTYRELLLTAGFKASYRLTDHLALTANGGVGYNMLDEQSQVSAAYAGGGGVFVTEGANLSPWLYTAGIGLTGMRTGQMDLSVTYDLAASPSGFLNQMGAVLLRMRI
ncbi:autotransporter outer membrane beta-barrel domain-containing protein [Aquabacter cavernae]|uniref:autotransporter family protein n=1 Tax=Aquabacter cavernae TaxID=2496029 RepID=UPI000F8DF125|nr:autotransporter outer membrane beta-barrel domain-containing protein [Aquabacter cavernae]